jgi:hypothetical protein
VEIPNNLVLPVIVEGEFNWLSMMAQAAAWSNSNHDYHVPGMAVDGKKGCRHTTITELLDGELPIVIYDNDAIDWDLFDSPKPGGYSPVLALLKTAVWAITTDPMDGAVSEKAKDVDEWVNRDQPSPWPTTVCSHPQNFCPVPSRM